MGIKFFSSAFFKILLLILFGFPTKPSSSASGTTSIILFSLVFIEIAAIPFFLENQQYHY